MCGDPFRFPAAARIATVVTRRASKSTFPEWDRSSSTREPAFAIWGKRLSQNASDGAASRAHILISHTHWDHIQGLPFFSPLYREGNQLEIYARQREDTHLPTILAAQNDDPYFPVPMSEMRATVNFNELADEQKFSIDRAEVRCTKLNHPWVALAYRVEVDGVSVAYASDTAPFSDILFKDEFISEPPVLGRLDPADEAVLRGMRERLVDLCKGVDYLIYDTQFTQDEYRAKPHWGHSTPDDAIAVAREAGAKALCLFHHAPARSDDEQDALYEQYRAALDSEDLELHCAREGAEIDLSPERSSK